MTEMKFANILVRLPLGGGIWDGLFPTGFFLLSLYFFSENAVLLYFIFFTLLFPPETVLL